MTEIKTIEGGQKEVVLSRANTKKETVIENQSKFSVLSPKHRSILFRKKKYRQTELIMG